MLIAEIGRAGREHVRLQRLPTNKIRAGFHYHGLPAGPVYGETKLMWLHAEAVAGGFNLWQPERVWNRSLAGEHIPANGAWQMINLRICITFEKIKRWVIKPGSITFKKDSH